MTWGELKAQAEAAGLEDCHTIDVLDVYSPLKAERLSIYAGHNAAIQTSDIDQIFDNPDAHGRFTFCHRCRVETPDIRPAAVRKARQLERALSWTLLALTTLQNRRWFKCRPLAIVAGPERREVDEIMADARAALDGKVPE